MAPGPSCPAAAAPPLIAESPELTKFLGEYTIPTFEATWARSTRTAWNPLGRELDPVEIAANHLTRSMSGLAQLALDHGKEFAIVHPEPSRFWLVPPLMTLAADPRSVASLSSSIDRRRPVGVSAIFTVMQWKVHYTLLVCNSRDLSARTFVQKINAQLLSSLSYEVWREMLFAVIRDGDGMAPQRSGRIGHRSFCHGETRS